MSSSIVKDLLNGKLDAVENLLALNHLTEDLKNALRNQNLPLQIMERISESTWWEVLVEITQNKSIPVNLLENIAAIPRAGIYHYEVQQSLLNSEMSPEKLVTDIRKGKVPHLWSHLEPMETLRRNRILTLAADSGQAWDELITLGKLYFYSGNLIKATEMWTRRFGVMPSSASDPIEDVSQLSFEHSKQLASHPLTAAENLEKLSYSGDEDIESLVAGNPSTPPCIVAYYVESLFSNGEPSSLALSNPVVPEYVWNWVASNLKEFEIDWQPHYLLLTSAAANHGLPIELMKLLSEIKNLNVRTILASNICVPEDIRSKIL